MPRVITRGGKTTTIQHKIKRKFWRQTMSNANISLDDEQLNNPIMCETELDQAWRQYNQEKQ